MHRFAVGVFCLVSFLARTSGGQNFPEPMHVPAGTVLIFHLQTRLNPGSGDALELLPKGTLLEVKILDAIDSGVNRDGYEFHGFLVSPVVSQNVVIVHPEAEVHGLFALLRSRNHPQGFRYELLITGVTDRGKSYALTASLNPSFVDSNSSGSQSKAMPEGTAKTRTSN